MNSLSACGVHYTRRMHANLHRCCLNQLHSYMLFGCESQKLLLQEGAVVLSMCSSASALSNQCVSKCKLHCTWHTEILLPGNVFSFWVGLANTPTPSITALHTINLLHHMCFFSTCFCVQAWASRGMIGTSCGWYRNLASQPSTKAVSRALTQPWQHWRGSRITSYQLMRARLA